MSASSENGPVAELRHVRKRRGSVVAVDDLTLSLAAGQTTAILGSNGAGKSTTVALLTGRLRPDQGDALLFGQKTRPRDLRARCGVMLQSAGMPHGLTVAEQIDLFRGYYPAPRDLREIIALAGLEGLERRRCSALSGGQQRRVQFALAICGRPSFLVLDEPTTGLDVEARRAVWGVVHGEADRGATVLLTTHYLEEAEALADRIVVIAAGRIIADGSPQELKESAGASRLRCITRLSDSDLAALPGVASVSRDGEYSNILTQNPPATLRGLLALDTDVGNLSVVGASLEEAFLRLVERTTPAMEAAP